MASYRQRVLQFFCVHACPHAACSIQPGMRCRRQSRKRRCLSGWRGKVQWQTGEWRAVWMPERCLASMACSGMARSVPLRARQPLCPRGRAHALLCGRKPPHEVRAQRPAHIAPHTPAPRATAAASSVHLLRTAPC
jgi:hypothetical protein